MCVLPGDLSARIAVVAILTTPGLLAQIHGAVLVNVSDPSGAVVAQARVALKNMETGAFRAGVSGVTGAIRFAQLSAGVYELRVDAPGFAPVVAPARVSTGAAATVAVKLEVSASQQEVVIVASAASLNTVNAQLQTTYQFARLNLPVVVTGGVLALAGTAPGIVPVPPRNSFLALGSFNSNGGRGRGNNITLDNATATDITTTGATGLGTVPLDAIKEVSIVTNSFTAEYGRNASAQFQIVTRNGSNSLHGNLWEFFRNDKLNARDWFDRTGRPSIERNNKWGGLAGGPLVTDKLFWFGSWEQQKIRGAGSTRIATVPTTAQAAAAADPASKELLSRLKVPTDPSGTVGNPAPNTADTWAWSGRADWNVSRRNVLFGRIGMYGSNSRTPSLTFLSSNLPTNGVSSTNRQVNATLSDTHSFSASLVNHALISFGRGRPLVIPLSDFGGPAIDFNDGTSSFGIYNGVPQGRAQNTYQYLDSLAWTRGTHQIKAGVEIHRLQANSYLDANVRGSFLFLTLADFLQGRPFQYSQRFGSSMRGNRITDGYLFLQDDWRVARRFTLNLGLRYEANGGVSEVNGLLSNLDLAKRDAQGGAGAGPLGAFYTGGTYFHRTGNWGPRLGFAWNPDGGKTSIRGAYGIAYDFLYLNPVTNGRFLPPYMYNFSLPNTDIAGNNSYARLIAGTSDFQAAGREAVGGYPDSMRNFGAIAPVDRGLKNPQVQQFSFTVDRELPLAVVARLSYSGAKGNFLQRSRPINTIAPGVFTPPSTPQEEQARQSSGEFNRVNAALTASLTGRSNRIDPRFNGVTLVESSANSSYHSLQFQLTRRFFRGSSFTAAYTYSKSIDDVSDALAVLASDSASQQNPFDNRNNRAVSQFDIPHRFVLTHNFEPRLFPSLSNRIARAMIQGWTLAGIFQAQSGFPVNLLSGTHAGLADSTLLGGGGVVRPNLDGRLQLAFETNPGLGARNPNKVTGSNLAQPLTGAFGTLGRNVIRVNPLIQSDMAFGKNFRLTERTTLQFQAQFENLFNNTTFSRAGLTLSAPATFGYYADTDSNTRNTTLILRLIW